MSDRRLEGRVALVTGASRGYGAAVAVRLAAEGAQVILAARTTGGLEETDDAVRRAGGTAATLVPLDLADGDAADRLGAAIYQRFRRLDILIGNAAVLGSLRPVGHFDPADWQRLMAVNLTANWRLMRSFDALLRQSDAGRAVFVTCGQAASFTPYWSAYAASKAALEVLARTWAAEVGRVTRLRVNLVDPGPMRTRLRAEAFPGEDRDSLKEPAAAAGLVADLAMPDCARNGEIVRFAE